MMGKLAGAVVLAGASSEAAAVPRVFPGITERSICRSRTLFSSEISRNATHAEAGIAHPYFPFYVSPYLVQLELQVHNRAHGKGCHQFHVAAILADIGHCSPGVDVAALPAELRAARAFIAWTLAALSGGCGCRFWGYASL